MADIRPFAGCRPHPDVVHEVACLPYDVLSSEEARALVKNNQKSFLRVIKAEVDFDAKVDLHSEAVYQKGAENLREMISAGTLISDAGPCLYVYQQKMGDHVQVGVVAGASVQEYQNGLIKKHELTRPVKEDDRAKHVEILDANTGPVFLTYRSTEAINDIVNQVRSGDPEYDFVAEDGVGHTLWVIEDADSTQTLVDAFAAVEALYVADGHHRSAAAGRVYDARKKSNPNHTEDESYNHFLSVMFPDQQLQILGYNRVVKDLGGMSEEQFLEKVGERFAVEKSEQKAPCKPKDFGMFLGGQWYKLTAKAGTFPATDPVESIDAAILQANLLNHVLGIEDPRTDNRIDFVGGIRGTDELERRCDLDAAVAFSVYPVEIEELIAVADANQVMPPKCTWFEPKLRSGMLVKMLSS